MHYNSTTYDDFRSLDTVKGQHYGARDFQGFVKRLARVRDEEAGW